VTDAEAAATTLLDRWYDCPECGGDRMAVTERSAYRVVFRCLACSAQLSCGILYWERNVWHEPGAFRLRIQ